MKLLKLDLVSDVVCPWCYIGFKRLQIAMHALQDEIELEIDWRPFELNPQMPPEGELLSEHIARKYGASPERRKQSQLQMAEIGQQLGIRFAFSEDRRIYNTFNAHRVLYWARAQGRQTDFALALFHEYFTESNNPAAPEILIRVADQLGMDGKTVADICASDRFAEEVRAEQRQFLDSGVQAVPAFIINQRYLISGAQDPLTLENALRQIAAKDSIEVAE